MLAFISLFFFFLHIGGLKEKSSLYLTENFFPHTQSDFQHFVLFVFLFRVLVRRIYEAEKRIFFYNIFSKCSLKLRDSRISLASLQIFDAGKKGEKVL